MRGRRFRSAPSSEGGSRGLTRFPRVRIIARSGEEMARITRRELKRNELAATVGRTVDYVSHHRRGAIEALSAAGAILVLAAAFLVFRGWREGKAGRELSRALE